MGPSVLSLSSSFSSASLAAPSLSTTPPPPPSASLPSFSAPSLASAPVRPPALPSAPRAPAPPFSSFSSSSFPSSVSSAPSLSAGGPPPPLASQPSSAAPSSASSSSSLVSSPVGDLAEFQARVLGLSAEYQALGRWFVASGGTDFCTYIASYCSHLYSDFHADFASGSSRFLAALASAASFPLPSSATPPVSSSAGSSLPPVAPLPPSSSSASAASSMFPASSPVRFPAPPLSSLPSSAAPPPPQVFSHSLLPSASGVSWSGFAAPVGSAVAPVVSAAPVSLSDPLPPPSAPFLFRPFSADPGPSAQVPSISFSHSLPSPPAAPVLAHVSSSSFASADPLSFSAPTSSSFVAPDELPVGVAPDALPHDDDSAVPDSVRSEFRRMLAFLVDLFSQAVGSHSSPPPPRALFEDFFGSVAPHSPPIFLSWFERVSMALSEADSRLSSFLSSGRSNFFFLPPRNYSYVVKDVFAPGQAVPVNPSLLSLYEKQLKPSYHVGLTVRKAAALESSLWCHAEALSHSMWVLSGLLGFVQPQTFAPSDVALFNTPVTSLSKSLAHQASLCASHTAFLVLKRRHFYLSHLPVYFSDTNKRSMLSAPAVCSDFLFAEADVALLLADTQTASSFKLQQALVGVASRSVGARSRRASRGRQSPGRRRRDSGSPSRGQKRVHFEVVEAGFSEIGVMSFAHDRRLSGSSLGGLGVLGCQPVGCGSPPVRLPGPVSVDSSSFRCSHSASQLLPIFHQGVSSDRCGSRSAREGGHRAGFSFSRLLQPPLCHSQSHWGLAACDQPLQSQLVCSGLPLPHGDTTVGPPVSASGGLDGFPGPEGRLPSRPGSPRISLLSEILCWGGGLAVSRSLFRPFHRPAGVHACHGSDLVDHASSQVQDPEVPGRLTGPRILVSGPSSGEGLPSLALSGARCPGQSGEEFPDSFSDLGMRL